MERYKSLREDRRNILPKDFGKWIKTEFGDLEDMAYEYDTNIFEMYDNIYDEDDYNSYEEYKKDVLSAFYNDQNSIYIDWIQKYKSMKFPMKVYRVISLKAKNLYDIANIDLEKEFRGGIGIYWTDGKGSLESYWGKGTKDFTVKAIIKESDVDWKNMLDANMNISLGQDEREIRLIEGTKILLTGIAESTTANDRDFESLNFIVKA